MMDPLDVDRARSGSVFSQRLPNGKKSKKVPRGQSSFLGVLESIQEPSLSECPLTETEIETLLDGIYQAGHELVRFPCLKNIQEYKRKIGLFFKAVVHGSVELVEVEGRLRKDMKKPKYALIKIINEKLDQLACFVLKEQKDKFYLLDKINELYGLLIDLKH